MSDIVIKAEDLGKSYLISHQTNGKYDTLRDVIVSGQHARNLVLQQAQRLYLRCNNDDRR